MYDDKKFEKESVLKKKGFYLALCIGLICLLAIGIVYYRMGYPPDGTSGGQANEGAVLNSQNSIAGQAMGGAQGDSADTQQKTGDLADAGKDSKKGKKDKTTANENKKNKKKNQNGKGTEEKKKESVAAISNGGSLNFQEEAGLLWPVQGDVIMKYSMSNTVYFKTLAQYRCNPAIEIAAKAGTEVLAAADGIVTEIGENEETGKTVRMEIGNNYSIIYGQLKNIKVKKGQKVKEGDKIGVVNEPTKYFAEEGSNLYFQVLQNEETVDPLLLLR